MAYCKAAGVSVVYLGEHCCIIAVLLDQQYCVRSLRKKQRCKYDPNEKEQTERCRKERVSCQETVTGCLQHNRVHTHTKARLAHITLDSSTDTNTKTEVH